MFSGLTDRLEVDMDSLLPNRQEESSEENELFDFFPSLTWQERLGGCLACMLLGYMLSLGSFFRFRDLLDGNPTSFVLYTTVGNIISLSGSFFLAGPKTQVAKMLHPSRKIATLLYIGSLVSTLVVALAFDEFKGQGFILLLLVGSQYVSVAWYCLSYIPFARQIATRLFGRCVSLYDELD